MKITPYYDAIINGILMHFVDKNTSSRNVMLCFRGRLDQ